jgi:hypothetical protein
MATVCRPKAAEGEARVLRHSHATEEVEVFVDEDFCCGFHSSTAMPESIQLDISHHIIHTEARMGSTVPANSTQQGQGLRFLCSCPVRFPFRTHGVADGRLAREGICLLMIEISELC